MIEIGEKLKEARESIGITVEEVSEDLKVRPSQVEEVEKGNIKALKDIFSLKNFIRDYSKYLGLSYDDVIDEFNEYLFDYTSQISLEDIKKARNKDDSVKKEKKVISPYTMEPKKKNKIRSEDKEKFNKFYQELNDFYEVNQKVFLEKENKSKLCMPKMQVLYKRRY